MNCTRTPRTNLNEIADLLRRGDRFLISTHVNPDGDALGSQLALYSLLRDMGKSVDAVNTDPVPRIYRFLPFSGIIQRHEKGRSYRPEYLIVLDAGGFERIGRDLAGSIKPERGILNIDHHSECLPFGDLNFIDPDACATSEIILRLIRLMRIPLGRERAVCLYTGILTDTGGFRFSNVTPDCLRAAADLVQEGVDVQRIYETVYETNTFGRVKLLGEALNTLRLDESGRIAWIYVTGEMFRRTGTGLEDLEGFINHVRSVDGVEVAMMFVELNPSRTKVSLRSRNEINVARIASLFDGGGHERAAGCTIDLPIHRAIKAVMDVVKEAFFGEK
ncbi:bifunctional oligoribonuclease/PAP phosphatase NrnA [Candidatus Poribacteria bacterium]|nr:bifunctional oligoribonuclease/PAP phosphatase NrnA [Candidatus Poribacteria bacterium]